MILGKRKDSGAWQILASTRPEDVRVEGAWSNLIVLDLNSGIGREYVPTQPQPKWVRTP